MKVLHVITGLGVGGAEMMLYKLIQNSLARKDIQNIVLSLGASNGLKADFERLDCTILEVKVSKRRPISILKSVFSFNQIVVQYSPNVIQGWMYHANVLCSFGQYLNQLKVPMLWNIRHSIPSLEFEKFSTKNIIRYGKHLSQVPEKIIYNSHTSKAQHEKLGYSGSDALVIPNGFDTEKFQRREGLLGYVREELRIGGDETVFGCIGRFHPIKGHRYLLEAFTCLARSDPKLHLILVGPGINQTNELLTSCIPDDIGNRIHLLGVRDDIVNILHSINVFVLPSLAEGFPNVVGEAMACEVPCIVTNVGDAEYLVKDTGSVISPGSVVELKSTMLSYVNMNEARRSDVGRRSRKRITENFSIGEITNRYIEAYESTILDNS